MPPTTDAQIAEPSAHDCLHSETSIFLPITSASICITNGDFCEIPPTPMMRSISIPFFVKWSVIARIANAVDSTSA